MEQEITLIAHVLPSTEGYRIRRAKRETRIEKMTMEIRVQGLAARAEARRELVPLLSARTLTGYRVKYRSIIFFCSCLPFPERKSVLFGLSCFVIFVLCGKQIGPDCT